MKPRAMMLAAVAVCAALYQPSWAVVTFSNITVTGSLSAGAGWVINGNNLVFTAPNANVGDTSAGRFGQLNIVYDVQSTDPIPALGVFLSPTIAGSGQFIFNEVIEDLAQPGFIGEDEVTLISSSTVPYQNNILFSRTSTNFRVKKSFVLAAPDGSAFDTVSLGEVVQTVVPEPSGVAALLTGGAALVAFRLRRGA